MNIRNNFIYIIILAVSFIMFSCSSENKSDKVDASLVSNPKSASGTAKSNLPVLEFGSTKHDFGIIIQGEKVPWTFKFKNTGNSNLIISNVNATCGCTVPKWSRKPIPPGKEGEIEVVFNSAGKSGAIHKNIRVMTNTQPNITTLEIMAEVFVPRK